MMTGWAASRQAEQAVPELGIKQLATTIHGLQQFCVESQALFIVLLQPTQLQQDHQGLLKQAAVGKFR